MKILFISQHKWPHIGGVEKHIDKVAVELKARDNDVQIISGEDISPPKIKVIGLLYIWYWFLKNRKLIKNSDIVHIHDVFIWYLPFKLLYPFKKVFTTFHGWEGEFPIPLWNRINKKIANKLSNRTIAVGRYIEKWYGIKPDKIMYGGVDRKEIKSSKKIKNSLVYLGRKDADTGYFEFLNWIKKQKTKYNVKYLSTELYPEQYLRTAEYCVPAGYLSYIEAKLYGCKIITFASNQLKEDYWNEIKAVKDFPNWNGISKMYIKLWEL